MQYLPARQRAVLILRDLLAIPTNEVAEMLGTTTAAVKSALQRARARLEEVDPQRDEIMPPTEPRAQELLEQYIAGFEMADTSALERALRADAAIEMLGTSTWFSGRVRCLRFLEQVVGSRGDWLMIPTTANGQPAAAAYFRGQGGTHRAFGLGVLEVSEAGIARIVVFGGGSELAANFGLPPVHAGELGVRRTGEQARP